MKHKQQKVGNLDMTRAMIGKRSSNAAGKHADKRTKRARTRAAATARAIKEQ